MPKNESKKEQIERVGTGITRVNTEQFNEIQSENEREAILAVAVKIETQIVAEYIKARETNKRNVYQKSLDKRKAFYEQLIRRFYSDTANAASIINQLPEISHLELKEAKKIRNIEARLAVLNRYMEHELELLGVEREISRHKEERGAYKEEGKDGLWIKKQTTLEKSRERILRRLRIQEQQQQQQQSSIGNVPAIPPVDEEGDHSNDENDEALEEIDLGEHEKLGNIESFLEEVQGRLGGNNPITSLLLDERLDPLYNLGVYVREQVELAGKNHPEVDDDIVGRTIQYVNDLLYGSRPDDLRGLTNVEIDEIDRTGYHEVIFQFTIDAEVFAGGELDTRYPVKMILHYDSMPFRGLIEDLAKKRLVDAIEAANDLALLDEIENSLEEKLTQEEDRNELRLLIAKKRKEIEAILDLGNLAEIDLDDLVGQLAEQVKVETGIPLPSGNSSNSAQPTAEQLNNLRKINQAVQQKVAQVAAQQNLTAPQVQQLAQQLQNNLLAQYDLDAVLDVLNDQLRSIDSLQGVFKGLSDAGNVGTTMNDIGSTIAAIAEGLEGGVEGASSFFNTAGEVLIGISTGINFLSGVIEAIKAIRIDSLKNELQAAGVNPTLLDGNEWTALGKGLAAFADKTVPAIKSIRKFNFAKQEMSMLLAHAQELLASRTSYETALQKAKDTGQSQTVIDKIDQALREAEVDLIVAQKNIEKHSHTVMQTMGIFRDVLATVGDVCFLLAFVVPPAATVGAVVVGLKVTNQAGIAIHKATQQLNKGQEELYQATVPEYLDLEQRLGNEFFVKAMPFFRQIRHKWNISKTSRHKLVARLVYSLKLHNNSPRVDLSSIVSELIQAGQSASDFDTFKDEIGTMVGLNNSTDAESAQIAFDIFKHSKGLQGAYARTVLGLGATGDPNLENRSIQEFDKDQFLAAVERFKELQTPNVQHNNRSTPINQVLDKFAEEVFTVIYQYFDMY